MDEYISRVEAIKALMNDAPEQVGYSRKDAAACIQYMESADVAPVRHGRWEMRGGKRYCTSCGERACVTRDSEDFWYTVGTPYCSNCGAKMDLKDEEHE